LRRFAASAFRFKNSGARGWANFGLKDPPRAFKRRYRTSLRRRQIPQNETLEKTKRRQKTPPFPRRLQYSTRRFFENYKKVGVDNFLKNC